MEGTEPMKIRLLKHWRTLAAGQVCIVGGGVADTLIRRGIAAEEPPASTVRELRTVETAAIEPDATVRTADATPKRRARR
jgi:hypothetical protein